MTEIGRTVAPDLIVAGGQVLDVLLGPLAAYLDALEARVGAPERRLSAVPLMTAADAARYTRVNVETILCAVRAGELPVAGYVGRRPLTPDLSRCPQQLACHEIGCGGAGFFAAPPALRYEGKRGCRGGVAGAGLNVARQLGHGRWPTPETHGHVMDEPDEAAMLAALNAILQPRSGTPPERPGLTVSSG